MAWLDEENLLLTIPSRPLRGEELVENILADDREHFFVAGISFMPPQEQLDEMYREAGLESVKFGLAKPDLVEITRLSDDRVMWKVIDAKASRLVKVCIVFYTRGLKLTRPRLPITSRSISTPCASNMPYLNGFLMQAMLQLFGSLPRMVLTKILRPSMISRQLRRRCFLSH